MENKTKGMTTCKICGRDFPLIAEEHYTAKEATPTGIMALAGAPRKMFDAFDCPHCGCQNLVNDRYLLSDILGRDLPLEDDCCCEDCSGCDKCQDNDDDPVCPFPKGGECYCKDSCDSSCEFHPDHKVKKDERAPGEETAL